MSHARTAILVLAAWAGSSACAAATLDECPAKKYKPCASFTTSRTIDEHTPLIDAATGFTRSKGSWTIHVSYGPAEKCAKVCRGPRRGTARFPSGLPTGLSQRSGHHHRERHLHAPHRRRREGAANRDHQLPGA